MLQSRKGLTRLLYNRRLWFWWVRLGGLGAGCRFNPISTLSMCVSGSLELNSIDLSDWFVPARFSIAYKVNSIHKVKVFDQRFHMSLLNWVPLLLRVNWILFTCICRQPARKRLLRLAEQGIFNLNIYVCVVNILFQIRVLILTLWRDQNLLHWCLLGLFLLKIQL